MVSKVQGVEDEGASHRGEITPDAMMGVLAKHSEAFCDLIDELDEATKETFINQMNAINDEFTEACFTDKDDIKMQSDWNSCSLKQKGDFITIWKA